MIMAVIIFAAAKIMLLLTVPMLPAQFRPPVLAIKPMAELSTDLPVTTTSDFNGICAHFTFNLIESVSFEPCVSI
jgi:hypothetical protein